MEAFGQVKGRKYPSNHAPTVEPVDNLITCSKCGKTLPQDRFYKNGNRYRSECIACKLKADSERKKKTK